jgi:trans-2,3-dihydro-3-hydroxyanthranilate isomerase
VPRLRYDVVDVFTDTAFTGNPLAVVQGAEGLPGEALQAITREFNLSETAFPLPVDGSDVEADYRLRIFTPATELPFAGHPSVGAAWLMVSSGQVTPSGGVVRMQCGAGVLPLRVEMAEDRVGRVELTGAAATVGEPLDPAPFLAAVGLTSADLAGPAVRVCSVGLAFAYLNVTDEAVARVRADPARLEALAPLGVEGGVSVFAWADGRAHTRVLAHGAGITEDPATGSAGLAFGAFLAAAGMVADGTTPYLIEQGREILHPSKLHGTVVVEAGRAVECRIAGDVVPVAEGTIRVPDVG